MNDALDLDLPPLSEEEKTKLENNKNSNGTKVKPKNPLLDKTPDKKLEDSNKEGLNPKDNEPKKEELNNKEEKDNPKDISELEDTLENSEKESEEKPFNELDAIRSFGEAITKSKNDLAGTAILKWMRSYSGSISKFSESAKYVIYSELDKNSFINKAQAPVFPEVPSDITPEEQSRLCIDAFARIYLYGEKEFVDDQDSLSIKSSLAALAKEKQEKESKIKEVVFVDQKGFENEINELKKPQETR